MHTKWALALAAVAWACDPPAQTCTPERCNGLDDDCDGQIDEDASDAPAWHADADGDGAGDASSSTSACEAPAGAVADGSDCDDTDPDVHPGAQERCNGFDDDCDALVDDADPEVLGSRYYADADQDGYGVEPPLFGCPGPGRADEAGDCDDTDAAKSPADADGDGFTGCGGDCDDADPRLTPVDTDGDGYSACDGDCDDDFRAWTFGCLAAASAPTRSAARARPAPPAGRRARRSGRRRRPGPARRDRRVAGRRRPRRRRGPVQGPLAGDRDTASADALVWGDTTEALAGHRIVALGDVDGDGYDDVAITAPYTDSGRGFTFLLYGSPTGPAASTDLASLPGWTREAGWDVYGVPEPFPLGDLDGDGWSDYALSGMTSRGEQGEVQLAFGDGTRLTGVSDFDAHLLPDAWAGQVTERLGSSIAVSDLDGDGFGDLVFGAETAWDAQNELRGRAYVAYGGPDRPGQQRSDAADASVAGSWWSGWYGTDVAGGFDLDGDGFEDFGVHELYLSDDLDGAWWFYRGGPTRWAGPHAATEAWLTIQGPPGVFFGTTLAVGDFDGDGSDDLAFAAADVMNGRGAVYVFRGPHAGGTLTDADADLVILGSAPGDRFGEPLLAGDVDGNGRSDLVIGAVLDGFGTFRVVPDGLLAGP
ncbi:MAG: putative metal-binding motif-containing protein [Myxococcota bacterium]